MKHSFIRRMTALVLILGMLLPVAADATTGQIGAGQETSKNANGVISSDGSAGLLQAASIEELTRDSQILKYIDEDVLIANQHVIRLPEEETLSSYAFLNTNGMMTVYYMDKAVKFVDESGKIVEKDISVKNTRDGFATVTNDVSLHLPNDPEAGISLSYSDYCITLVPEGGALRRAAQNSEAAVTYPDYFGTGASLVYTPMLDGLKEDIVLDSYTGVTSFAFRLFTDGLRFYQENGHYYLAESAKAKVRINMGDVVAFDARGRFSVGSMAITTVEMGREYVLTLSVDEAFLTNASTAYPVSIDPTLTVSDNTHGAGAIEDITLYSGAPNANCDWPYLHCGYYDSTYKVARTMFRLTGLLSASAYQSATAGEITSAKFYIKEATGTAALPVHIYANAGSANWTETGATWNNALCQLGTQYATASPGVNQVACYDITNLVKAWKNGTASAQAGFVLVSSNETTKDKAFYSSEATNTANRSYVVVEYEVGNGFENAINIGAGLTNLVNITTAGEQRYFIFKPSITDFYTIESQGSNQNAKVWLYNYNYVELDNATASWNTNNFSLTYHLVYAQTYYIVVGNTTAETSSYSFLVKASTSVAPPQASGISISSAKTIAITGAYETQNYRFVPDTTGEYIFQSSNAVGDPKIWIYDSNLIYCDENDDGGGNGNFRLTKTLNAGSTYYIVLGHFGNFTGTYGVNVLKPVTVSEDVCHLKNIGTDLYLDIHGPNEQRFVHQWSKHYDNQGKWSVKLHSDGYYTIQSKYDQQYYLGISTTNTGENNIVLYENISDNTRWKIYETTNTAITATTAKFLIEPKNAKGKTLCAPNTVEGAELQLCWMSVSINNRNKWGIGIEWDIELEGKKMSNWCWAAATRVFCKHYLDVPDTRTQETMVTKVKGGIVDQGGDAYGSLCAVNYYSSGDIRDNPYNFIVQENLILTEEALQRYLDDGHVVYIWRMKPNSNTDTVEAHACVIIGYTTFAEEGGGLNNRYILFDPDPIIRPDPWDNPEVTVGRKHAKSYQWICNGKNMMSGDSLNDGGIWVGYLAVGTTSYAFETMSPVWNE